MATKVFISSTGFDLKAYRQAAIEVCNELGLIPLAMEFFEAMAKGATAGSKSKLDQADVYVGIFAHRYGYIEEGYERSVTEVEFDYGEERGLERLCFVVDPNYPWPPAAIDHENHRRLEQLKQRVDKLIRAQFTSVEDFKSLLLRALLPYAGAASSAAGSVPHQVPRPPQDFTGRVDELNDLSSRIGAGAQIIAIHGMGGSGKTALALEVAEQLAERYPDGHIYLDLQGARRTPVPSRDAMAHVIGTLRPEAKLSDDEAELRAAYLSVLHGKRVLLLMDNAAGKQQVTALVPPAGCVLLVTARTYFVLPGGYAKRLQPLPREDAVRLVVSIAPHLGTARGKDERGRETSAAQQLARLCGDLPQALRLAASTLAEHVDLPPDAYLQRVSDTRKRLQLVEAVFDVSYELLPEDLRARWRILAVFSDSFIDLMASFVWDVTHEAAQEILSELVRLGLLEWQESSASGGRGRYRLHDLAKVFAVAKAEKQEMDNAQRRHVMHHTAFLVMFEDLSQSGSGQGRRILQHFHAERNNIDSAITWAIENSTADKKAARMCVELVDRACRVLGRQVPERDRIRWLEGALPAAERLGDRKTQAQMLGNLAIAFRKLGQPRKTIELVERSRLIRPKTRQSKDERLDLSVLADAHSQLGEYRQAIELYGEALKREREAGDRRGEAMTLSNLSLAHQGKGEHTRALELTKQAITLFQDLGDKSEQARVLANLGNLLVQQGETLRAVDVLQRSLTVAEETTDPHRKANSLLNLALAWSKLGESARADESFEGALVLCREAGDLGTEAQALFCQGESHLKHGHHETALGYFRQGADVARHAGDLRREAGASWGIGIAELNSGAPERAVVSLERALQLIRSVGSRRDEAGMLDSLADAYSKLGDDRRVREINRQQARLKREIEASADNSLTPATAKPGPMRTRKRLAVKKRAGAGRESGVRK